jgi:hypothetical protein
MTDHRFRGRHGELFGVRAEDRAGITRSQKSIIMVYLSGGLAHQDSFDLKPAAPKEVRGEFNPVDTSVPGIQICELLPNLAAIADKYALIRSIVGLRDEHSSFQTITGYPMGDSQRDGRPHFGSVVSRVLGNTSPVVPAFVDLFPTMQHRPYNSPGPGAFGNRYSGVKADGEDLASMKLRFITPGQFHDRRRLLEDMDRFRKSVEGEKLSAADSSYQRAFDVLTSSRLVEALDVEKEDPAVRERYGKGSPKHQGDGAPLWNDQLLVARRLVEAGVRCVSVGYGFWDTHGNNFGHLKQNLPIFDKGIAALVRDVYERGLDKDVTVVVWGEFGRTPKINKDAGRDHWPRVSCALLAGGGMKTGQTIGTTDRLGGEPESRPVTFEEVHATLYHNLGINLAAAPRLFDFRGRPQYLVDPAVKPIKELI